MTALSRPRVLDASALVEVFSGHPEMMALLDTAAAGDVLLIVPTLAIAEAQTALDVTSSLWDHILGFPGIRTLDLSQHVAVEVGRLAGPRMRNHPVHTALIGPLMAAQVLYEATTMNAAIVTSIPEAYGGHDVAIYPI
ncbi:hypothetical protein [Actinoplanes sp. NPDC026670]|uniref:hypothetical protein n=1 Tax=Actinoplanes sp. NPDC026670 TaxID=3154700 RepID=UPI0033C1A5C0